VTLCDLSGIEECKTDAGKISINRSNFLNQGNFIEVHMHPTDQQGTMAISPNNAAFLLNMHMPIVSFTVVLKAFQSRNKNGVFFVNIIN